LALSKSLVELHGGNFNISSVVGEGTTVTFTLPVTAQKRTEQVEANEVGSEISRLAQDIADVLQASDQAIPPPLPAASQTNAA